MFFNKSKKRTLYEEVRDLEKRIKKDPFSEKLWCSFFEIVEKFKKEHFPLLNEEERVLIFFIEEKKRSLRGREGPEGIGILIAIFQEFQALLNKKEKGGK